MREIKDFIQELNERAENGMVTLEDATRIVAMVFTAGINFQAKQVSKSRY